MACRKASTHFQSLRKIKVVSLVVQLSLIQYHIGMEADLATKKFWTENKDFVCHTVSSLKAWQT